MEQRTSSKLGKEYAKAAYCHPAYLTYMQSTPSKMPSWMDHKLGIKFAGRNINNFRYADDTTPMAESEEELNSLLIKVKEQSEKAVLKPNIQKNEDHGIGFHHFMAYRWEKSRNNDRLSFTGFQNQCIW